MTFTILVPIRRWLEVPSTQYFVSPLCLWPDLGVAAIYGRIIDDTILICAGASSLRIAKTTRRERTERVSHYQEGELVAIAVHSLSTLTPMF